jgi:hypothetical protein
MSMRYFKRAWDETRGDEFNAWGTSTWMFETDDEGNAVRQIELYANGSVLTYDRVHLHDRYGMLSDKALDVDDFAPYEIASGEFEDTWSTLRSVNR